MLKAAISALAAYWLASALPYNTVNPWLAALIIGIAVIASLPGNGGHNDNTKSH